MSGAARNGHAGADGERSSTGSSSDTSCCDAIFATPCCLALEGIGNKIVIVVEKVFYEWVLTVLVSVNTIKRSLSNSVVLLFVVVWEWRSESILWPSWSGHSSSPAPCCQASSSLVCSLRKPTRWTCGLPSEFPLGASHFLNHTTR